MIEEHGLKDVGERAYEDGQEEKTDNEACYVHILRDDEIPEIRQVDDPEECYRGTQGLVQGDKRITVADILLKEQGLQMDIT